jgi:hypothetical protein
MNTNTEFWERVHLALDERRDPLEDDGIQDAIASDPRLLDELLLLQLRLARLPSARASRRVVRVAAAAAVVIAAASLAFTLSRTHNEAVPAVARTPITPPARSEIIDFELTIVTERPGERDTVVIDRTGTRRTREIDRDELAHSTWTTEVLTPRGG